MRWVKIIVLLSISILVFAVIPVYGQSTLSLQEKCSEGAKKFVERLDSVVTYDSHYNKKLDKCFIRVGFYFGVEKEKLNWGNGKTTALRHPQTMQALYNVFDGKMIGRSFLNGMKMEICYVENTKCKPHDDPDLMIDEFENLIRPYMEN
jgi:hypothetical protein